MQELLELAGTVWLGGGAEYVHLPLCLGVAAMAGELDFCKRRSVMEIQNLCSWVGCERINHMGSFENFTL